MAALRQGGKGQRSQADKAQVTDAVLLVVSQVNVAGAQVGVEITAATADGHGGAQIKAQVHSAQVGHGVLPQQPIQGGAVGSQQVHIKAGTFLHGDDLPVFIGQETLQPGKPLQQHSFLHDALGKFLEIFCGAVPILESTGQQQGFQLGLGRGDREDLNDIFFPGFRPHGRAAADAVMVADGIAHQKAIQQGGDQFRLGHSNASLSAYFLI